MARPSPVHPQKGSCLQLRTASAVYCAYAVPNCSDVSPGLTVVFLADAPCRASDLALVGAKIYPSPTEPPIENGSILMHQGQILAVGPAHAIKIPRGATIIDCKGLIVTAGFWNSHVHIFTPGLLRVRDYMHDNNIHIPDTETIDQAIALVRDHAAKGADGKSRADTDLDALGF
jgi:hypothetical protein